MGREGEDRDRKQSLEAPVTCDRSSLVNASTFRLLEMSFFCIHLTFTFMIPLENLKPLNEQKISQKIDNVQIPSMSRVRPYPVCVVPVRVLCECSPGSPVTFRCVTRGRHGVASKSAAADGMLVHDSYMVSNFLESRERAGQKTGLA